MDQQDSLQSQMFHNNFTASNDKEKAQLFDYLLFSAEPMITHQYLYLPHLPIILNRNIQA